MDDFVDTINTMGKGISVIRAFIAVALPDDIKTQLAKISTLLQSQTGDIPVRWIPIENIHLTLKFLGDISIKNVELLTKMLDSEVASRKPFEISVGGLGAFPNVLHPRVIWVGIQAPDSVHDLQRAIEAGAMHLGYDSERGQFSPHLTLGRVSRNANARQIGLLRNVLKNTKVGFIGVARVTEVSLYRSTLQASGPVYSRLFTSSLVNAVK